MFRLLFFYILFTTLVYASDKVEIYATTIESKNNIIKAHGDIVVVYKEYFLNAKEAIYNKITSELELFDNIRVTYQNNRKVLGSYAKLNLASKEQTFQPLYMLETKSKVWLSANEGCSKDSLLDIDSGIMSGCNPDNPLWKMEFTSSDYNTDTKWLNLYNTRIYIYDIPVLYLPYFGYSLDTTRKTGLLKPSVGISDKEGFYYEQPLFIAESNWWDLELKPQIRTNRGYGVYSQFRFVDSRISKGNFKAGYFKEKDIYFVEEDLANRYHFGFNFEYDNSDFINQWFGTKYKGQSGIYADINNMNDVDYINLASNDTTKNSTATHVLSRINMFHNSDENYFGTYFKYYKDLTKESNEDTLQKLPTFQYHYYLDTLFDNHLLYNLDLQSNYIYKSVGKTVVQTNVNIPVTLQKSFFDEYLNLSYKAQLYAQHSSFYGSEEVSTGEYNNGIFARNYHILNAYTQLTKPYEEFLHVVSFGSSYTMGGSEFRDGFYDDTKDFCSNPLNQNTPQCEFYNITDIDDVLELDFSQYIFDLDGKQRIYHRLAQKILYENSKKSVGELENELDYQISDNIKLYNNMFYNYDEKTFSKIFNKISYNHGGLNLALSHLYKDTFLELKNISPYSSYITSSARYTYNDNYSYHLKYDYDIEASFKKSAEIGFLYSKRCWDFGLKYVENNRPALIQNNKSSSVYDRYIFFNIALKPLMSSGGTTSDFRVRLPDALRQE